jgi:hypothetical protein
MGAYPLGDEVDRHETSTPRDDQSIQLKQSNKELSANLGDGVTA